MADYQQEKISSYFSSATDVPAAYWKVLATPDVIGQQKIESVRQEEKGEGESSSSDKPHRTQQNLDRARQLVSEKNYEEALTETQNAIKSDPTLAEAHFLRGQILQRKNDQEAALSTFSAAIYWNPRLQAAQVALGQIYLARGDRARAIYHSKLAIEIDPNDQEAINLKRQIETGYYSAINFGTPVKAGHLIINVQSIMPDISLANDRNCASCPKWIAQMNLTNNAEHSIRFPLSAKAVLSDGKEIECDIRFYEEKKIRTTRYVPLVGGVPGWKNINELSSILIHHQIRRSGGVPGWKNINELSAPSIAPGESLSGKFYITPEYRLKESELKTLHLLINVRWTERGASQETWFKLPVN